MSPTELLAATVRKHQAGLLLDTNLLLLFLADDANPEFARRWKRTARLAHERYLVPLRAAVDVTSRMVTTPHVLTEATNLTTNGAVRDKDHKRLKQLLRDFTLGAKERFVLSKQLANDPAFTRLGLADVAQMFLSRRRRPLVLTDDAPLAIELGRRGLPVANLTNYAFPIEEFS
jgi:hypothetical protein